MDYRLIFLSLGSIVISWGGVPLANPGMALKLPCLSCKIVVIGKSVMVFNRVVGNSRSQDFGKLGEVRGQEKRRSEILTKPYRQPTLVDWSSRPRRAGELSSRNSAKKLSVRSQYALPMVRHGIQQKFRGGLFNKNTGLC